MEPEPISISVLLLNEDGWKIIGSRRNYCMFKLGSFCPATARDWILQSARCLIFLLFTIMLHRPCVHNLTVRACANCILLYRKRIMTALWTCIELQMRFYDNRARITDIRWLEPRTKRDWLQTSMFSQHQLSHTSSVKRATRLLSWNDVMQTGLLSRMSSWKIIIILFL